MTTEKDNLEEDDMIVASGYQEDPTEEDVIIEDEEPVDPVDPPAVDPVDPPVVDPPAEDPPVTDPVDPPAEEPPVEEKPKPVITFESDEQKWVYQMLSEGKEDEVLEALNKKHGYKTMSQEDKAVAYLKTLHPSLDDEDLTFKAETEYGIGEEAPDEFATDEDKAAFKAREIKRKELLYNADDFFKSQSEAYKLPALPSIEEVDPDYKSYKEFVAKQAEDLVAMKKQEDELIELIDTTSVKVEKIEIKPTIQLDDREFSFVSEFKLDENKRKELATFAKSYTPSQEEQDEFFPQDGKFNMEGYLGHLAGIKFKNQIINAAVKEGIAKAREEFVEKDLKNSTLRNNDTQQQASHNIDPTIAAMEA